MLVAFTGEIRPRIESPQKFKVKNEPQYVEGQKALDNFEQLAKAVLRAPKPAITKNPQKSASRKPKNADKD
jgi:hypothetical protein